MPELVRQGLTFVAALSTTHSHFSVEIKNIGMDILMNGIKRILIVVSKRIGFNQDQKDMFLAAGFVTDLGVRIVRKSILIKVVYKIIWKI